MSMLDGFEIERMHNRTCIHQVFGVTMASGEKWIVDPAGSQYGWRDGALSWVQCIDQRLYSCRKATPHETYEALALHTFGYDLSKWYQLWEQWEAGNLMYKILSRLLGGEGHGAGELRQGDVFPEMAGMFHGRTLQQYEEQSTAIYEGLKTQLPVEIESFYSTDGAESRLGMLKRYCAITKCVRDDSLTAVKAYGAQCLRQELQGIQIYKAQLAGYHGGASASSRGGAGWGSTPKVINREIDLSALGGQEALSRIFRRDAHAQRGEEES